MSYGYKIGYKKFMNKINNLKHFVTVTKYNN